MCIAVRKLERGHETGKEKRLRGAKGKDGRVHVGRKEHWRKGWSGVRAERGVRTLEAERSAVPKCV